MDAVVSKIDDLYKFNEVELDKLHIKSIKIDELNLDKFFNVKEIIIDDCDIKNITCFNNSVSIVHILYSEINKLILNPNNTLGIRIKNIKNCYLLDINKNCKIIFNYERFMIIVNCDNISIDNYKIYKKMYITDKSIHLEKRICVVKNKEEAYKDINSRYYNREYFSKLKMLNKLKEEDFGVVDLLEYKKLSTLIKENNTQVEFCNDLKSIGKHFKLQNKVVSLINYIYRTGDYECYTESGISKEYIFDSDKYKITIGISRYIINLKIVGGYTQLRKAINIENRFYINLNYIDNKFIDYKVGDSVYIADYLDSKIELYNEINDIKESTMIIKKRLLVCLETGRVLLLNKDKIVNEILNIEEW